MNNELKRASDVLTDFLATDKRSTKPLVNSALVHALSAIQHADLVLSTCDEEQVTAPTIDLASVLSNDYVVSWSLAGARVVERSLSTSEVPPRMDVAMVMYTRSGDHYKPFGVIGGYRFPRENTDAAWP